ncbi:hypothetical protein F4781DRAFT_215563 [Annulohypoxylon bovei var. microspora]|nr:hypothetical protein F4781DRAFT_215563 [Annulohypoxylon bovei var. microspora]
MGSPEYAEATQPSGVVETIHLEHIPSTHTVHMALFKEVTNSEFLQQQLLKRNAEFEYAFIDATSVVSRFQLLAAAYKAITVQQGGNMKTPNVHSEIVCSLSPNNNISEAYRRFGITAATQSLIIIKVLVTPPSTRSAGTIEQHLLAHVHGIPTPLTDAALRSVTDWPKVRKYYKLNGVGYLDGVKDEAFRRGEMEVLVLEGMALRNL